MEQKRPWVRKAIGGLIILIALILSAITAYFLANDLSLWVFGRHTTGWVVDLWVEPFDAQDEGELLFEYFARYQFVTSDGKKFTGETKLSATEWSRLTIADPGVAENDPGKSGPGYVEVVYFPLYPQHNRLAEGRLIPVLACAYVPLIVLCWVGMKVGMYLLGD